MSKLKLAAQHRSQNQQQATIPELNLDEITRQMLLNGEVPEWFHDGLLDNNYRDPDQQGASIFKHFRQWR